MKLKPNLLVGPDAGLKAKTFHFLHWKNMVVAFGRPQTDQNCFFVGGRHIWDPIYASGCNLFTLMKIPTQYKLLVAKLGGKIVNQRDKSRYRLGPLCLYRSSNVLCGMLFQRQRWQKEVSLKTVFLDALASLETTQVSEWAAISPKSQCSLMRLISQSVSQHFKKI